jgi:hypothetical protein
VDDASKSDLKARFPEHYFCKVIHAPSGYEAIIAIPKRQRDEDHADAAELWHGGTVTLP